MPASNAAVLRKAANLMKERGHAKGVLVEHETGRVCLLGAISLALCGDPVRTPARSLKLADKVGAYLGRKFKLDHDVYAVGWNNERARTQDEVIAALRGAARSVARS